MNVPKFLISALAILLVPISLASAATAVQPFNGGTGITTSPSYGQLLVGNSSGGYSLAATSTLGITASGVSWGAIVGTLSSQTDLQNALNSELSLTSWYATTTNGLNEGTNNLYFTNARARAAHSATYPILYNSGTGVISTVATSSLSLTTASFASPNVSQWTNDAGYVTSSFSTTSAAYWQTQNNFFSTTSAGYFLAQNQGNAFSTTSVNAWSTLQNYFSTTSSSYFLSQNTGNAFSTTSANAWIIASSSLWGLIHTATTTFSAPLTYTQSTNAVSCPTCLTANQTITLSGAISGSGSSAITTTYAGTLGNTLGGTNQNSSAWSGNVVANAGVWSAISTTSMNASITGSAGSVANSLSNDAATLTGSSFNGSAAVSNWAINLTHANSWTGLQTFANASSTLGTISTLWLPNLLGQSCLGTNAAGLVGAGTCSGGSTGPATSTNPLMATYVIATSTTLASTFPYASSTAITATSGFFTYASTTAWSITSTSTGSFGINLSGGCFAISGTCLSLTTIPGTLSIAKGGTNATTFTTSGNAVYYNGSSLATALTTGSVTIPLASTTQVTASSFCLTTCLTVWPSGTVTGVTASAPLFSSGGAAPNITWAGLATTSQPASSNLLESNGGAGVFGVSTSSQSFSGPFAITGTIGALVGGSNATINWTGLSTTSQPASSNILVSNGGAGVYGVATSSISVGASLSSSGTLGSQIGGTASALSLNLANPNTWTGLQTFNNATSTLFTATSAWFANASTTSFSVNGTNVSGTSTVTSYISPAHAVDFPYATSTAATGTSSPTVMNIDYYPVPFNSVIYQVTCVDDVGTWNADVYDGSTHLKTIPVTSTLSTTSVADVAVGAGTILSVAYGTPASSPTSADCNVFLIQQSSGL